CCYKETRINPRVMPPETGLEMATRNGAKAALLGDRIGAIEVGKEADIVLFDTDRPEWQPLINPVSNLVYSATGDSVRDVFVAGERVVARGRLTKIDEEQLYREIPVAVARFGKLLPLDRMVQLRWPVA
ncbi:MAG: amidohydrolase family protein, partial [Xanthobacteraceae bacterium]